MRYALRAYAAGGLISFPFILQRFTNSLLFSQYALRAYAGSFGDLVVIVR